MYDPIETDISYEYLSKLNEKASKIRWAVIGGWGVFLQVKKEYLGAFGQEYLKSRDIDVFIDSGYEKEFFNIITNLGFKSSSYGFRYELIYDREEKKIIPNEKAKKKEIFNLIYIFLDVFSDKKTKEIGSWVFQDLTNVKIDKIGDYPILGLNSLLRLKVNSFFEREKLDKELKDACDIFALLFYSGKKFKIDIRLRKAIEKIIARHDLQDYIAENVLNDNLKSSLVAGMLRGLIG